MVCANAIVFLSALILYGLCEENDDLLLNHTNETMEGFKEENDEFQQLRKQYNCEGNEPKPSFEKITHNKGLMFKADPSYVWVNRCQGYCRNKKLKFGQCCDAKEETTVYKTVKILKIDKEKGLLFNSYMKVPIKEHLKC